MEVNTKPDTHNTNSIEYSIDSIYKTRNSIVSSIDRIHILSYPTKILGKIKSVQMDKRNKALEVLIGTIGWIVGSIVGLWFIIQIVKLG